MKVPITLPGESADNGSEVRMFSYVGHDAEIKCLQPVSCHRVSGRRLHQRQIYDRVHPANVPRSFHSPLPFLVILGFPCLSLACRLSPLRHRYEFHEPDAEESRSIKVTLSALPGSLAPTPSSICKDNGSLFQSSEKPERAVKCLIQI